MRSWHLETHRIERIGWLRAAVLGANDGIVSTASLLVGVASAGQSHATLLITGMAGLVAGAMSMAAGEYVSVSSQADAESADRQREANELANEPEAEREELVRIYVGRGLTRSLAEKVAEQLTETDAFKAHLRDELGLSDMTTARPIQAAVASAAAFGVGAALPLVVAALAPETSISWAVTITSLLFLAILGATGAVAGGAPVWRPVLCVTFWGAFAMAATAVIGAIFGTIVA